MMSLIVVELNSGTHTRTHAHTHTHTHVHTHTHAGQHTILPPHPLLDMSVGLDLSQGQSSSIRGDSRKDKTSATASKDNHLLARCIFYRVHVWHRAL